MIRKAAGSSERLDKGGPIALDPRVPKTGVTGRGMSDGANPRPLYLVVHVDCDRCRAKEKVADIYVGDVGSQDGWRTHKSASGKGSENPLRQSGTLPMN